MIATNISPTDPGLRNAIELRGDDDEMIGRVCCARNCGKFNFAHARTAEGRQHQRVARVIASINSCDLHTGRRHESLTIVQPVVMPTTGSTEIRRVLSLLKARGPDSRRG